MNSDVGEASRYLREVLRARNDGRELVTSLYLAGALKALLERQWLMTRDNDAGFADFVSLALTRELAPLAFLGPWFKSNSSAAHLKTLVAAARDVSQSLALESSRFTSDDFRAFLRTSTRAMADLCVFEDALGVRRNETFLPPSAYRAFDVFDDVFGLSFESDRDIKQSVASPERLYIGGGAGVQTSYATILSALENLRLPQGGHLVDLGSGFGRVGLVAGLWREDLRFTGYEYVGSRVHMANESAARAGHADRIRFVEQDLSAESFRIPLADAYYMYDPFCGGTYERVIRQLNDYSRDYAITVVTKADAGNWLMSMQAQGEWIAPEKHDSGLLWMFRSAPPTPTSESAARC